MPKRFKTTEITVTVTIAISVAGTALVSLGRKTLIPMVSAIMPHITIRDPGANRCACSPWPT